MTRRLVIFTLALLLMSVPSWAQNRFKITNEVLNDTFIPTIVINGKSVLRMYDKGEFLSAFDRAQYILNLLIEMDNRGENLKNLGIRQKGDNYSVVLNNITLFTVSNGDAKANNSTSKILVTEWTANIRSAVAAPTLAAGASGSTFEGAAASSAEITPLVKQLDAATQPAIKDPDLSKTEQNWKAMTRQADALMDPVMKPNLFSLIVIFLVLQIITVIVVTRIVLYRLSLQEDNVLASFSRLDELQNSATFMMKEIEELANQVYTTLDAKTSRTKRILERAEEQSRRIQRQIDLLDQNARIPTKTVLRETLTPAPRTVDANGNAPDKQLLIVELKEQGRSLVDIAKELNIGIGEVILALNLKNK